MNSDEYDNGPVVAWASQKIIGRIDLRPLFGSRWGMSLIHLLLFSPAAVFFAIGVFFLALGSRDQYVTSGPIFFGALMLIPAGMIALLGAYVRRGFATSLDAEGVNARLGLKFPWRKLRYIDHVTKHVRAGGVSRRVKDNQLELAFEGGKVIIPPMINDRQAVWELINSIPAEVRDDGSPRVGRASTPSGTPIATQEDLMRYLQSLDPPPSQTE